MKHDSRFVHSNLCFFFVSFVPQGFPSVMPFVVNAFSSLNLPPEPQR